MTGAKGGAVGGTASHLPLCTLWPVAPGAIARMISAPGQPVAAIPPRRRTRSGASVRAGAAQCLGGGDRTAYDATARMGAVGPMMVTPWEPRRGVLELPSGRRLRGRALRRPLPDGPAPTYGVYLARTRPPAPAWAHEWIRWRDFWLPTVPDDAREALARAWRQAADGRVEVACSGGRGRTGTALACLAVLDGVPPGAAVAYVREHYDCHAAETPWQRRYVERFSG